MYVVLHVGRMWVSLGVCMCVCVCECSVVTCWILQPRRRHETQRVFPVGVTPRHAWRRWFTVQRSVKTARIRSPCNWHESPAGGVAARTYHVFESLRYSLRPVCTRSVDCSVCNDVCERPPLSESTQNGASKSSWALCNRIHTLLASTKTCGVCLQGRAGYHAAVAAGSTYNDAVHTRPLCQDLSQALVSKDNILHDTRSDVIAVSLTVPSGTNTAQGTPSNPHLAVTTAGMPQVCPMFQVDRAD
jgi:hypothetical protein